MGRHLTQAAAQSVHAVELLETQELLLTARPAGPDVDRGIDALFGERAIELDLAVPRALELLEDHVVHSRSGLHEGRGNDRQRSAARRCRDGAGRSKECLRLRHRRCIESARQGAARASFRRIVSSGHARERIENDDDILSDLDEPACPLQDHLRNFDVSLSGLIEARGDNLAHAPRNGFAHFLGTFIDEQNDERCIRVIERDTLRYPVQEGRLTGAGRCDDQGPLPISNRRDQIDRPPNELRSAARGAPRLERELSLGIRSGKRIELRASRGRGGIGLVDRANLDYGQAPALIATRGRVD